jgi:acetylornithine/succinyldiaminopimelate/putrescine aminotransferase
MSSGSSGGTGLAASLGFSGVDDVVAASERYWNPGKTRFWVDEGIPLVIDRREGYHLYGLDGRQLLDVHLNGGTYNLGHRNAEVVAALVDGVAHVDIGNHHFPSMARAALARELIRSAPPGLDKVIYASGGGEAIDIALKTARHATGRTKIVSIVKAYHGHTGLAVCTGDDRFSELFRSARPEEFPHVPFNDLDAMAAALAGDDVAAVIMETIPATYGFPLPAPGYLEAVKGLCERHGTLYIADEVQTGLGRTGELWGITKHGIRPDLLVTGKGLSGGVYPIAAVLVSDAAAGWLTEDGFAHMSTFGGAELGCLVALKTLEITTREATRANVLARTEQVARGLAAIRADHPDWFVGIRQNGLVLGLEFEHPTGAKDVMRELYDRGVWAIFSTLDPRVLQYKPGILMTEELTADLLDRTADAIAAAGRTAGRTAGR